MLNVTILCIVLTAGYVLLMAAYAIGWRRQKDAVVMPGYQPCTFISVVVPARNERDNIGNCIAAILAQQYPAHLFEVIVADDHSEDGTAQVVAAFKDARVRCISLADHLLPGHKTVAYKKAALTAAIAQARGQLIVTTDADCIAPPQWLLHMAAIYERDKPAMIVAPVIFSASRSVVQVFQLIDFMSMQGITAAAHSMKLGNMSNGANLAFTKKAFDEVRGYDGIDNLASGDDYLLMMKISHLPGAHIGYLKSAAAIVSTPPQPDWGSFLQQRIRWASKSGKYNDPTLTGILMLVYLFNLSFGVLGVAGLFNHYYWLLAACLLLTKTVVEFLYMLPVSRFFGKTWTRAWFPFLQPLHIVYIILAGFMGFIGNYTWKDRKVK